MGFRIHVYLLGVSLWCAPAVDARAADEPILPGGVSLLPANVERKFALSGQGPSGKLGEMTCQAVAAQAGLPFAELVRVRTLIQPERDYHLQLICKTVAPVAKGDVCLLRFYVRATETSDESGQGRVRVYLQKNGPDWAKLVDYDAPAGATWKRYDVPFVAAQDYPAGGAALGIALGYKPQTVELGGIALLSFGPKARQRDLPRTPQTYPGIEPDAPWRAEAGRRIEEHRKGDLALAVTGPDGKPLVRASVQVRMKRHAFGFGSALNLQAVASPGENNDRYRQHVFELFNRVVNENDLKWPAWESGWGGAFTKERTIAALKLLREKGYYLRGHCLVWPSWRNVPARIQKLKDDPAALREAVRQHIVEETTATRGLIDEWDVMNEPFSNHDLMDVCGKDVMVEWWKTARQVLPDARLYINDYGIVASGGATDTAHQRHYEETIRYLLDQGAPLGGIGIQSHFRSPTPPETVWKILDRFAKFHLPLSITEFDIDTDDEGLQAAYTRDYMTAVFAHPAVDAFIMWGFWESRHWRPRAAMFRRDWSVKPNGEAYRKLVFQEWWTDASATTDTDGACKVRGFLGDYEVTVTHGQLETTQPVKLQKGGSTLKIRLEGR